MRTGAASGDKRWANTHPHPSPDVRALRDTYLVDRQAAIENGADKPALAKMAKTQFKEEYELMHGKKPSHNKRKR